MQHMHAVAKLEFAPFPEFKTWLQGLGRRCSVLEFRNWQVGSLKEALGKRTLPAIISMTAPTNPTEVIVC